MTLDSEEFQQVTEIAARVAAEAIRNLTRGTGGANMPIPMTRLGTVGGTANAGAETLVKADGDSTPVPAVNATGTTVEAGDRVLVEWVPPSGVFVTNLLARSERGNWTPSITGPSSVSTGQSSSGHYTRSGHTVTIYGSWTFGVGTAMGTAATLSGFPFPAISDGDGVPGQLHVYHFDAKLSREIGRAHV